LARLPADFALALTKISEPSGVLHASHEVNERSYGEWTMTTAPILIAGAGPTGMTLAIELRRFGLPVRLIDKATYLAAHSQALVVQARTLEQFQRYGLAQTAIARGRKLTRATFVSDGKVILSIPLERIPSRYPYVLFLPQSETEQILNAHMESLGVQA
jgi:2-polyprenyl-6-methoxyphenol hydroxylase-like FAD-dependent oxidoreductase